jgi:hypothetical protein
VPRAESIIFDEPLGDLRLETFGVALAETHDVRSGTRQAAPSFRAGILPRGVVHVAGFRIDGIRAANARAAAEFLSPGATRRAVGYRLVAELVLAPSASVHTRGGAFSVAMTSRYFSL